MPKSSKSRKTKTGAGGDPVCLSMCDLLAVTRQYKP